MTKKRKSRELAMQILFLWDTQADQDLDAARQVAGDSSAGAAALEMAQAAWQGREPADQWVARLAPQWPPHRQPAVDRNLLRLAIWELTNTDTPPKVVIDEAIELAKAFSTEQSAAFVNGVLDAILKEHQLLIGAPTPAVSAVENDPSDPAPAAESTTPSTPNGQP